MKMQHFCGTECACTVHVNHENSNTYKNTKKKRTVLIEYFGKKTGIFMLPEMMHIQITTDKMRISYFYGHPVTFTLLSISQKTDAYETLIHLGRPTPKRVSGCF
jgi:hypothetical protein